MANPLQRSVLASSSLTSEVSEDSDASAASRSSMSSVKLEDLHRYPELSHIQDKKLRRLVKNRIAAKVCRNKKKHYLESLEGQVAQLQHTMQQLREQADTLSYENEQLVVENTLLLSSQGNVDIDHSVKISLSASPFTNSWRARNQQIDRCHCICHVASPCTHCECYKRIQDTPVSSRDNISIRDETNMDHVKVTSHSGDINTSYPTPHHSNTSISNNFIAPTTTVLARHPSITLTTPTSTVHHNWPTPSRAPSRPLHRASTIPYLINKDPIDDDDLSDHRTTNTLTNVTVVECNNPYDSSHDSDIEMVSTPTFNYRTGLDALIEAAMLNPDRVYPP